MKMPLRNETSRILSPAVTPCPHLLYSSVSVYDVQILTLSILTYAHSYIILVTSVHRSCPQGTETENMVAVEASQVTAGNGEALQWFLAAHVNSVHITPFPARKYHPKTWI